MLEMGWLGGRIGLADHLLLPQERVAQELRPRCLEQAGISLFLRDLVVGLDRGVEEERRSQPEAVWEKLMVAT